jgi:hypothetical protein
VISDDAKTRSQERVGEPRTATESPGLHRTAQESSRTQDIQDGPGTPRKTQESPGEIIPGQKVKIRSSHAINCNNTHIPPVGSDVPLGDVCLPWLAVGPLGPVPRARMGIDAVHRIFRQGKATQLCVYVIIL